MTAKNYLEQISLKNARINNLIKDKENMLQLLYSLGCAGSDERVQSSPNLDRIGTVYAKIDEKEREIVKMIDDFVDFRTQVTDEINKLNDSRYVTVLHKRYVQMEPLKKIAVELQYDYRHVTRLNGQALKEFEDLYEDKLKRCPKMS